MYIFGIEILSMARAKRNRGYVINYEHVPDDCLKKILAKQADMKVKLKRQVSMGEAITKLLRGE